MSIKRKEERVNFFKYKLTLAPASQFKDGKMRKANKAELRNQILQFNMRSNTTTSDVYIVDGDAHINQPNWNPECTYNQLLAQYLQYATSKYSNSGSKVVVAFDGYDDIHSTKSVEHSSCSEGVVITPDIKIGNLQMKVLLKKNQFLRNVNLVNANLV